MKERKNIIILVLIILFVILSIFLYFKKTRSDVIYIGNYTKVTVKKGTIKIDNKNEKIGITEANIYFNNEFVNGYIRSSKEKVNNNINIYTAYNKKGSVLRFNDDLIAYTGDAKIKVANPNRLSLLLDDDLNKVSTYLYGLTGNTEGGDFELSFNSFEKIIYDIDNDGDDEYIYSVDANAYEKQNYSFVVIEDNGEFIPIIKKSGEAMKTDLVRVSFFSLIDFDNDGKYEIVVKIKEGDYGASKYKIFNYDEKIEEIK